jgi:hypothetical protein
MVVEVAGYLVRPQRVAVNPAEDQIVIEVVRPERLAFFSLAPAVACEGLPSW